MKPRRPRTLSVLAALGLVLGSFGALYALSSARPLLEARDPFVRAYREGAAELRAIPPHLASSADLERLAEREAEALYARRGVTLPLAAVNLILSVLLFAGCARTLRGDAAGPATWTWAALVSIPYHLLDAAAILVQTRELGDSLANLEIPLATLMVSTVLPLRARWVLGKAALEILYFAGCVLYLRRAAVRALFRAD